MYTLTRAVTLHIFSHHFTSLHITAQPEEHFSNTSNKKNKSEVTTSIHFAKTTTLPFNHLCDGRSPLGNVKYNFQDSSCDHYSINAIQPSKKIICTHSKFSQEKFKKKYNKLHSYFNNLFTNFILQMMNKSPTLHHKQ